MAQPKPFPPSRPKYLPTTLSRVTAAHLTKLFERDEQADSSAGGDGGWIPVLECDAYFKYTSFEQAILALTLHPERNSSSILRADVLSSFPPLSDPYPKSSIPDDPPEGSSSRLENGGDQSPSSVSRGNAGYDSVGRGFEPSEGYQLKRRIRRRLMPKKPQLDKALEQECFFYSSAGTRPIVPKDVERTTAAGKDADGTGRAQNGKKVEASFGRHGLVVLVPDVEKEEDNPFYHPKLRKLAFHYTPISIDIPESVNPADEHAQVVEKDSAHEAKLDEDERSLSESAPVPLLQGRIAISVQPFPSTNGSTTSVPSVSTPADQLLPSRTFRTCNLLLETLYKHAYGVETGYEKRVIHDVIVEKTEFQDLYLVMKERHKHLDSVKDKPGYLNLLMDKKRHVWKDVAVATFLMLLWRDMYPEREVLGGVGVINGGRKWDRWGRPPGGFLDLGCGNALLVHILISEGYTGKGVELRSRRTWPTYPPETQACLVEQGIDPPTWFPSTMEEWKSGRWEGREECPVGEGMFLIGNHADEMTPWLPLLSLIPANPLPHLSLPCCTHTLNALFTRNTFNPPHSHVHMPAGDFEDGLEKGDSKYKAYLKWLGWEGLMCGWRWEREPLRVPSTKSWGIVARSRWTQSREEDDACREYVLEQVIRVRQAGFVVREKEGNPH